MNEHPSIGVYYALNHRYGDVLKAVRRYYPNSKVTAVIPKGHVLNEDERVYVDAVIETELAQYTKFRIAALWRLMSLVHAQRYDLFIVLFVSIRHRLIAGYSGAGRCEGWTIDGYTVPMGNTLWQVPREIVGGAVRGWFGYWRIWFNVHLKSTTPGNRAS